MSTPICLVLLGVGLPTLSLLVLALGKALVGAFAYWWVDHV